MDWWAFIQQQLATIETKLSHVDRFDYLIALVFVVMWVATTELPRIVTALKEQHETLKSIATTLKTICDTNLDSIQRDVGTIQRQSENLDTIQNTLEHIQTSIDFLER